MKKKVLAFILVLAMVFVAMPTVVFGGEMQGNGWYINNDGTLFITGDIGNADGSCPWNSNRIFINKIITLKGAKIENGSELFERCYNLTEADLSNLDTSEMTSMSQMFWRCSLLKKVNFGNIDTSNCTSMLRMFDECKSLTEIDVSGFDTRKCTDMDMMFYGCESLFEIDLSNFDFVNTYGIDDMFKGCTSLESIDLGSSDLHRKIKLYGEIYFPELPLLKRIRLNDVWLSKIADALISHSSVWYNQEDGTKYTTADALKALEGTVTLTTYINENIAEGDGWYIGGDNALYITGAVENTSATEDLTPWAAYKSQIKNIVTLEGAKIENGRFLFAGCDNLIRADLTKLNTSSAADMSNMFAGCSALQFLKLANLDTHNCINMNAMFSGCEIIKELDLSGFNTENCRDMANMFSGCTSLTFVDLSSFDTANCTDMNAMFRGCTGLKELDLNNFDFTKVCAMDNMFHGCPNLYSLDLGDKYPQAEINESPIADCESLGKITLHDGWLSTVADDLISISPAWYNQFVINGAAYTTADELRAIKGTVTLVNNADAVPTSGGDGWCAMGSTLYISGDIHNSDGSSPWGANNWITKVVAVDGAKIESGRELFFGFSMLTEVDLRKLDASEVTDMQAMFMYCEKLARIDFRGVYCPNLQNTDAMFRMCHELEEIDLSSFQSKNIVYYDGMFSWCEKLFKVNLCGMHKADNDKYYGFGYPPALREITVDDIFLSTFAYSVKNFYPVWKDVESGKVYAGANGLKTIIGTVTLEPYPAKAAGEGWYIENDGTLIIMGDIDNAKGNCPWADYRGEITKAVAIEGAKIESGNGLFENCNNLTEADLKNLDTSSATDMKSMFANCQKLTKLDIGGFNTEKVTRMDHMFSSCRLLTNLDLSDFNCSALQSAASMFEDCQSITELDLSSFNSSALMRYDNMFYGCSALTTVDISGMCPKVSANIFGSGNNIKKITVDGEFLKLIADRVVSLSPVWKNAENGKMYAGANALKAIDGTVTIDAYSAIAAGENWFIDNDYCLHIVGLVENTSDGADDFTPWLEYKPQIKKVIAEEGAKISNGARLFFQCTNLVSADLKKLDTTGVTLMNDMFSGCSNLAELDVSGFDTSSVTNAGDMFASCSKLENINVQSFDLSNTEYKFNIFNGCYSLKEIELNEKVYDNIIGLSFISDTWYDKSTGADIAYTGIHGNTTIVKNFDDADLIASGFCWHIDKFGCLHIKGDIENYSENSDETPWKEYKSQIKSVKLYEEAYLYNSAYLFADCVLLEEIDLSSTEKIEITDNMLSGCTGLKKITINSDLLNLVAEQLTDISPEWYFAPCGDKCSSAVQLMQLNGKVILARSLGDIEESVTGHAWQGATCTKSAICPVCGKTGVPLGHNFEDGYCTRCGIGIFEFDAKSLALDSALAFKFKGYLRDETPAADAYMEFKIGNIRTVNVPLNNAVKDEKGRYVFTCFLNALEVDEKIEAIFHDGDITVERQNPLSVSDYLDLVLANHTNGTVEDTVIINLVNAISNYAHYAQLALDETHTEYTVGADGKYHGTAARTAITLHTADELKKFEAKKIVADGFTDVLATSRSLVLDDETAIVIYITPASADYVPNVKVTDKNGNDVAFECELQDNGKYKVVIRGIAAHMLADNYTVDIDDGKLTYKNLSALSYAYSILSGSKSEAYKNAASALYDYYIATIEYQNGGHDFGELIPTKDSTCTETGLITHYQCSICGKYFDEDKNETTLQNLVIEAKGHTFATYFFNKTEHWQECTVCGAPTEREPHNYVDNNDGTATCTKCGASIDIFKRNGNTITGLTDIGKTLPKIVVPEGVTVIDIYAFRYCTAMEELLVPDSVTTIGSRIVGDCTNLKTVTIGGGITSLGNYSFCLLPNLTTVTCGSATMSLGNYTFQHCDKLEKIVFNGPTIYFNIYSIFDCPSLKTIEFNGTIAQWQANINGVSYPVDGVPSDCVVYCTDGNCDVYGNAL